ncbi:atp-binding cassette transporter [Phaffia rhodozyma]|uniref:Atp-binding cassette transporter n=1 Tax=Phaffia rhodozyma TaxID=264483 RepID=A0A0F7SE99_PHARH|nr:atp-binding cassette transporter [Phaffia rhodozyma]
MLAGRSVSHVGHLPQMALRAKMFPPGCFVRMFSNVQPQRRPKLPLPTQSFIWTNPQSTWLPFPIINQKYFASLPPTSKDAASSTVSSMPTTATTTAAAPAISSSYSRIRQFFQLAQFKKDLNYGGKGGAPILGEEQKTSLKKLFELAKTEKKPLTLGLICLVIASVCGNILPYCVGELMNYFGQEIPPETTFMGLSLFWTGTTLGGIIVVGALAALGRSTLIGMSGERIVARLRKQAYASVLHQEIEFTDSRAGNIVSRLSNDSAILGESISSNLSQGAQNLLMGSIGFGVMLYISVPVTFVAMIAAPATFVLSKKYGEYQRNVGKMTQEAVGEMTKVAEEKLGAARIIAAYSAQELETNMLGKKVDTIFQIARREIWIYGLFENLYGRISDHASEMAIVLFGGYMVHQGNLELGSLTSLLIYQYMVDAAMGGLIGFWAGLNKGLGAGERVFELIDRKPQVSPTQGTKLSPTRTGSIVLKDIAFSYPSRPEATILKKINLEVKKGESVAIVGGSGSGKSSIQNLILRFYEPTSGTISYDGEDITNFTMSSWRNAMGLVSQESIVFTGTIFDNIAYGKPGGIATRAEVEEAAREAGCEDFISQLDNGFDTLVSKSSLSGGQKQRLSIARALIRKPRILLLDEATSALDTASEQLVNKAISKILENRTSTVILVAHRLSSIAQADRVVVIEGGEVVEDGKFDELSVDSSSKFYQLMSAQLLVDPSENESEGQTSNPEDDKKDDPVVIPSHVDSLKDVQRAPHGSTQSASVTSA